MTPDEIKARITALEALLGQIMAAHDDDDEIAFVVAVGKLKAALQGLRKIVDAGSAGEPPP